MKANHSLYCILFIFLISTKSIAQNPNETENRIGKVVSYFSQAYAEKFGKIAVILPSYDSIPDNDLLKEIAGLDVDQIKSKFDNSKDLLQLGEMLGFNIRKSEERTKWLVLVPKKYGQVKLPTDIRIDTFEVSNVSPYEILNKVIADNKIPLQIMDRNLPQLMMKEIAFKWNGGTVGDLLIELSEKGGADLWIFNPGIETSLVGDRTVRRVATNIEGVIQGMISLRAKRW